MIGKTASESHSTDFDTSHGDDAKNDIQTLIDESSHVLDFTDVVNNLVDSDSKAIGVAVGILDDEQGKPAKFILSFAIENTDEDNVIVGEEQRTTIVLPISQAFTFGNAVIKACDALHDYIIQRQTHTVVDSLRNLVGNQKPETD